MHWKMQDDVYESSFKGFGVVCIMFTFIYKIHTFVRNPKNTHFEMIFFYDFFRWIYIFI